MKKNIVYFAVLFALITGGLAAQASAQVNRIIAERWELTQLNGVQLRNSDLWISIDGVRMSGNAGCNQIFGTVRENRNTTHFTGIGSTRKFCGDRDVMRTENEFLKTLRRVNRSQENNRTLKLYVGNRLVMQFRSADAPAGGGSRNSRLDDRKWVLDEIKGRPIPRVKTQAFISFDAVKGSAGGNTSCNGFGGTYTAKGDRLKISDVISTMRACIEDQRMDVERGFLDGLRNADRFEINGDRLYLYDRNAVLLAFRGEQK
jgi:heat shock protein HslJ